MRENELQGFREIGRGDWNLMIGSDYSWGWNGLCSQHVVVIVLQGWDWTVFQG